MVAPVAGVPGVNPVTAQIPNFVLQQLQTQRMQQLAAALSEQGQGPIDHDPRGRISWTQGLAKVLQGGLGAYLGNQGIQQQAGLTQQGMDAQGQAYGMGQPSPSQFALGQGASQGSVGPTNDNAARLAAALSPAQKQGVSGSVMATPYNPQGLPPQLLMSADYGSPGATAQRDALLKNLELTDTSKNNIWQGIPPDQAKAITLSDATNKGFHGFDPGQPWTNTFTGAGGFTPKLPDGTQPNAPFTPGSPIPSVGVVPGVQPAIQGNSTATALGTTAGSVHTVTNPDGSTSTGTGGNLGLTVPPQIQAGRDSDALAILQQERAKPGNSPGDNAALDREIARIQGRPGVVTGPDPTVQAGRTDQQTEMGKRWAPLASQAGAAQKVNSYLDQIATLSDKAATGQFSDRLQLTNSLLAPFSQKATDEVTARNLLDKYSNQIVAQLGAGGEMGTDAARSILHSAYPNAQMNTPAIHEAVASLKAQNVMAQAKARILQPAYSSNDPVAYTKAETAFDQAADPRIFQWRSIQDPAARRAFGAKIMAQDPTLAAKAKALEALGVQ